jgi:chromosome partitioning protein
MRVLAITNHKGGVGKTTVTYHLAGALRDRGLRGLVIDMDDQANLTRALLPLEDCAKVDFTARDLLKKDDQPLRAIPSLMEGVDLLPSRFDFLPIDRVVLDPDAQYRRAAAHEAKKSRYYICLIDCPPSGGIATRAAIVASDRVLVVLTPDEFSAIGIHTISELVEQVRKRANPKVEIKGYLLNRVDPRRRNDRDLVEALATEESIRAKFLKTRLSQSVRYVETMAERTPLTRSEKGGKYSGEVRSLANELFTATMKARKPRARR